MLILRFLRAAIYSTAELLGMVMGVQHRSAVYRTLKSLQRSKLIQGLCIEELGGKTLWGITVAGQRHCVQDGEEEITKFFNPRNVTFSTLPHYLDIQKIHIVLQKAGWKGFVYTDKMPRPHLKGSQITPENQYTTRPDLLAFTPDSLRAAIEMERHVKAQRRYEEHIIPGHIRKLNAREYDFVLWIARTPEHQETLEATIKKVIDRLREKQKFYLEARPTTYKLFQFNNLERLGN